MCHSILLALTLENGGNELELFLFFLLLPLAAALSNHHGIYKKNPDILGSTLWCLLTVTGLRALGFLLIGVRP